MGSLADHITAGLYPLDANKSVADRMMSFFARTFITTGSPEGAIVAPIGAECTDVATGIKYNKTSGVGNTGWVAIPLTNSSGEIQTTTSIRYNLAGLFQTTVGAAGGASALPATPTKYLKVKDQAGTTFVIPCYAA